MIEDKIKVNLAEGLDVELPQMYEVKQVFKDFKKIDVTKEVENQFKLYKFEDQITPGMSVAVGCGSRGIANIAECTKAVINQLKKLNTKPFVFPAMGSHGGATAQGQLDVLNSYGISEEYLGCPIKSEMDVNVVGKLEDGMPIYMDKNAENADGIVLISRIKPHTNFRAEIESGITKMLTIGMGKIKGASVLHSYGMDMFGELLPKTAQVIIEKKNFLFGVGMVESPTDETAIIELVTKENLFHQERNLLKKAKDFMPSIQFEEIDVLIIDQIGKNISGSGMDPNITGRNTRFTTWSNIPKVKKIVVLGLTKETHGNATGIGVADVITMRLYKDIDINKTYANVITSTYLDGGAIPIIMNTDKDAINLASKTVNRVLSKNLKIVRITNTLELSKIQVSEKLFAEVLERPENFKILSSEPMKFKYDSVGKIFPI